MYIVLFVIEPTFLVLLKSYADKKNQVFYAKHLDVFICSV